MQGLNISWKDKWIRCSCSMLRIILNQEFKGAKDVGLGLQNTTGYDIPTPGYAYIQSS